MRDDCLQVGAIVNCHIRKTPKPRRPATVCEWTAESAIPSTVRVSRGSTMPSS